jgi:hypothetical protein
MEEICSYIRRLDTRNSKIAFVNYICKPVRWKLRMMRTEYILSMISVGSV